MATERLNLKAWSDEDKPREKMLTKGISALSNTDLLAILLRTGTKEETVVELARRLLGSVHNNLDELGKLSIRDLCTNFKGIGETKAITLTAALELGRRRKQSNALDKQQITSSHDAYTYFAHLMEDLPHEEFWILLLNHSNKIINATRISSGGVTATTVDVKLILKEAVNRLASGIIMAHNHPSGNIVPSNEDKLLTNKIRRACQLFDIRLLDQSSVGHNHLVSLNDNGEL